jgi:predicted TIM-barrel fold metal-dependent hydrolase
MKKTASELPPVLPIDFGPVSNGEFLPRPPRAIDRIAERTVHEHADAHAKRIGVSRREFLASAAGTASALAVIDQLAGCRTYRVDKASTEHPEAARAAFAASGDAFVVDVQTHHVEATAGAPWIARNPGYAEMFAGVSQARGCAPADGLRCLARETYIEEIVAKTDVQVALLSGVPARPGENPLDNASIAVTRGLVDRLAPHRILVEGIVHPNLGAAELDAMQALAETGNICGWKVYTPWGPDGRGLFLDDAVGTAFLERVQRLQPRRVFLHKGLPWPTFDKPFASPRDIGPAAARFPDVQLVVYHSGFDATVAEGPDDPAGGGVDRLVASLAASGIRPGTNVSAELGGTWQLLMTHPLEAAHVLGKLLRAVGEDRILWGSDALFVGTPQPQIDALRAFDIPVELQDKHGYPALTDAIKRKILGGNAVALLGLDPHEVRRRITADDVAARKRAAAERPPVVAPRFGPRTRRELFALWARHGGRPA